MTTDDGFREIQLDGKQLVFLFMLGTIAVVAIFLCGVMVGRGVRNAAPTGPGEAVAAAPVPDAPPAQDLQKPSVPPASESARTATAPPAAAPAAAPAALPATPPTPPAEDFTYYNRLEGNKAPAETLKKPATPAEKPATMPAKTAAAPAVPAPETGGDFTVQVGAYRDKSQADAIVQDLVSKGYSAYIVPPPPMFRVRVGQYKDRREAETVLRRLEKEGQYKPWITR